MTHLAIWGAPGPQVFHAPAVIPAAPVVQPGPVDSGRIADTAFRRKKKRRIEAIQQPAQPVAATAAITAIAAVPALPARTYDFRTLAELSGKSVEIFRTEVEQEIAQLLADQQERDDEEALTLILAALED